GCWITSKRSSWWPPCTSWSGTTRRWNAATGWCSVRGESETSLLARGWVSAGGASPPVSRSAARWQSSGPGCTTWPSSVCSSSAWMRTGAGVMACAVRCSVRCFGTLRRISSRSSSSRCAATYCPGGHGSVARPPCTGTRWNPASSRMPPRWPNLRWASSRGLMYYNPSHEDGTRTVELLVGTPAIWFPTVLVLAYGCYRLARFRDLVWVVPIVGFAAGFLPWLLNTDRQMYLFYALNLA